MSDQIIVLIIFVPRLFSAINFTESIMEFFVHKLGTILLYEKKEKRGKKKREEGGGEKGGEKEGEREEKGKRGKFKLGTILVYDGGKRGEKEEGGRGGEKGGKRKEKGRKKGRENLKRKKISVECLVMNEVILVSNQIHVDAEQHPPKRMISTPMLLYHKCTTTHSRILRWCSCATELGVCGLSDANILASFTSKA